jgi:hypothetical protein
MFVRSGEKHDNTAGYNRPCKGGDPGSSGTEHTADDGSRYGSDTTIGELDVVIKVM